MKNIFSFLLLLSLPLFSQQRDSSYSITAEAAGGYGRYFTSMEFENVNKNGLSASFRIMWNPEHLLSVGVETGYQWLYTIDKKFKSSDFGNTDFNLTFTSIPVSLLFSMRLFPETFPGFRLSGGTGVAFLFSKGELNKQPLDTRQLSVYYSVAVNYTAALSSNLSAGSEIKFSHLSKIEDSSVSVNLMLVYRLLSW